MSAIIFSGTVSGSFQTHFLLPDWIFVWTAVNYSTYGYFFTISSNCSFHFTL